MSVFRRTSSERLVERGAGQMLPMDALAGGSPLLQTVTTDRDDETAASTEKMVGLLAQIEMFKDLSPEEAVEVAGSFSTRHVNKGDAVFLQGDSGHEIFFIESGTVEVKLKTASTDCDEIHIRMLSDGEHFGEAALLTNAPRNASIYAASDVVLKVLSRQQFDALGLREKMGLTLVEMFEFMDKIEAFKRVDRECFATVARALSSRVVRDGEAIVTQGEPGNELFFIEKGTVSVKVRHGPGEEESLVATLSRGAYFGEAALLEDVPRNASVYASNGDVVVKVLTREQFVSLGLKNKLDLQIKYAQLSNGMMSTFFGSMLSLQALVKVLVFLLVYCLLACAVLIPIEGWKWGDCVYFAIVTLTTVGFGDMSPRHQLSRICLVVLVLAGLMFVAVATGEFLERLVTTEIKNEKLRKLLRVKHHKEVGIFDQDKTTKKRRYKYLKNIIGIVLLLGLSTTVCSPLLGLSVVDAFYFSFVTLTTIGYGDIHPQEYVSKIFVSVLCLFGVPAFAMCLGRVVEIAYGKARDSEIHHIVGGLTPEKFNHLIEFCDEMWRKGAYNSKPQTSRRCEITPFEFLCFILVKNQSVTVDEIKAIMDNFSELDVDSNGTLEQDDLEEWIKRGSINPASLEREKTAHLITDHLSRSCRISVQSASPTCSPRASGSCSPRTERSFSSDLPLTIESST